MSKKINEASVKLDISGLESSDLETLSRILALSGQAELDTGVEQEYSTDVIDADALDTVAPEMPVDMGDGVVDFGADEDDFDIDRISSLAGIHEAQDLDSVIGDEAEEALTSVIECDESGEIDEAFLPDLSLDEDAVASDAGGEQYGPFSTEFECVADAEHETNGVEGDNFIIVPNGNVFYWKRTLDEDASYRPDEESVDTAGIVDSVHEIEPKTYALGDNHLINEDDESADELPDTEDDTEVDDNSDDLDESVDSIFESLTKRYEQFKKGF